MDSLEMEKTLIESYNHIFEQKGNEPTWAVRKHDGSDELVHCSIPFVGKDYASQNPKMLVYASAENLTYYDNHPEQTQLDDDAFAVNRHRLYFDDESRNADRLFPDVHITPMSDGCLVTAAFYIYLQETSRSETLTPAEFENRIAFANYGKYSIQGRKNKDYPRNQKKLKESHDYVKEDLRILKPNIIVLPQAIYNNDKQFIEETIRDYELNVKLIPIYQINAATLNCHIAKRWNEKTESLHQPMQVWHRAMLGSSERGISKHLQNKCLFMYSYLDYALKNNAVSLGSSSGKSNE